MSQTTAWLSKKRKRSSGRINNCTKDGAQYLLLHSAVAFARKKEVSDSYPALLRRVFSSFSWVSTAAVSLRLPRLLLQKWRQAERIRSGLPVQGTAKTRVCVFPKVLVEWTLKLTLRMHQLSYIFNTFSTCGKMFRKVCSGAWYTCAELTSLCSFSLPESVTFCFCGLTIEWYSGNDFVLNEERRCL